MILNTILIVVLGTALSILLKLKYPLASLALSSVLVTLMGMRAIFKLEESGYLREAELVTIALLLIVGTMVFAIVRRERKLSHRLCLCESRTEDEEVEEAEE